MKIAVTNTIKAVCLFLVANLLSYSAYCQGEFDLEQKSIVRNEKSGTFRLSSDGWSAGYRHGVHIDASHKTIYDFSLGEIRHPKQIKLIDPSSEKRFYYGKLNICYLITAEWGKLKELYRKFDRGSVSIKRALTIGGVLALEKPYYYKMGTEKVDSTYFDLFDASKTQYIMDNASYFKGISEIKPVPGAKVSLMYHIDFSTVDKKVRALEFGADISVFYRPLRLLATDEKRFVSLSLWIGYRFGNIYGSK